MTKTQTLRTLAGCGTTKCALPHETSFFRTPPGPWGRERKVSGRRISDDMRSESILIVDDNESNLRLMEAILGEQYTLKSAMDAEEALRMLRNWRPRLILTDIQLPGIDGLELTRRLKRDPSYQTTAIVALTAYAMKGDKEKALAEGCDGYITKPVNTRILPRMIRRYLEMAASREAAPKQSNRGRRKPACAPR